VTEVEETDGGVRRLAAIMFSDLVGYTARMGADEAEGIETVEKARRLQRPIVESHGGTWLQEVGDGTLCTFPSAVEAVRCALAIQAAAAACEPALSLRIGLHEGDIVVKGNDIFGDGVNVAARLQQLAAPGETCASGKVYDEIANKDWIRARSLGPQKLKNVARPVPAWQLSPASEAGEAVPGRGAGRARRLRLVVGGLLVAVLALGAVASRPAVQAWFIVRVMPSVVAPAFDQEIGFATTPDGVRIAYATSGEGPALVQVLGWFTHLERGLTSPAFTVGTGWQEHFFFVRFDGRGTGLSQRDVHDYSLDARVSDLEAVLDALSIERFSILAHSAGGPPAIAYAARNPERVEKLAFYGSFARLVTPETRPQMEAALALVRTGWGSSNPAYRQFFTSLFMPDGDELSFRLFNEWQQVAANAGDASRFLEALLEVDVRELAAEVRAPTLVIHRRGDQAVPYERGLELAGTIPDAQILTLEGNNHAWLRSEGEELKRMLDAVQEFVEE
jgi:class 3 adenylate cyclase/pimeloyl-ACP methyl ester carboxylesterase